MMIISNQLVKKKCEILNFAGFNTYYKYGYDQLFMALNIGQTKGYYKYFTNDGDGRTMLEGNIEIGEIFGLIVSIFLANGTSVKEIPKDLNKLYNEYINLLENRKINSQTK